MVFFPYALTILFSFTSAALTGSGNSTRIWNCCKPSCAWEGKANVTSPVAVCNKDNSPLNDLAAKSACDNGTAYGCADQAPWQVDNATAYGYSAVVVTGKTESDWCCTCFELTFTSGPAQGRKMTIQAVDTLPDMGVNQFSLLIPGGGIGATDTCTKQYGTPSSGWGQEYGGISSMAACDSYPPALKAGCLWRFNWFGGSDNPGVDFVEVTCPAALTNKTGCVRQNQPASPAPILPAVNPVTSPAPSPSSSGLNMNSKILIGIMIPMAAIISVLLMLWMLQRRRNHRQAQANRVLASKEGRTSSIIDKEKAEHAWTTEMDRSEKKMAYGASETQYYEMDGGTPSLHAGDQSQLKVVVPKGARTMELEGSPSTGELEGDAIRHSIVEIVLTGKKLEGGFF